VLPDLEDSWIERYGAVALGGEPIEFESFTESLGRHYSVVAYSPEPGRFAVIFSDDTERRATALALRETEMAAAAQEERGRLARDLHDSVTQALFAASLKAEALGSAAPVSEEVRQGVDEVRRLTGGALSQMRTMLLELRGEPLESIPIRQLLRNVVEATRGRTRTEVELTVAGKQAPTSEVHTAIYRITQEALNNVARHAGAPHTWVDVELSDDHVRLSVRDDGTGFDPGPRGPEHLGLRSMQERAAEAGGLLRLESSPGRGTRVLFDWPDESPASGDGEPE
jgi:signal transduction histidine kinase